MIELRDVVAREDLLRRADAVDVVARDADDCVRNAPRQIELVEREQHGEVIFAHHALEDGEQFQFVADVQEACRLVEHDKLRLLAQGPCEQNALPLAVADGGKRRVGERERVHLRKRLLDDLLIFVPQDAEPSRVGIAARADHIAAGHELRFDARGHQDRHAACDIISAARLHRLAIQIHCAGKLRQLTDDGFQDRRLARAVRPDERNDLSPLHAEGHILDEGLAVVADG